MILPRSINFTLSHLARKISRQTADIICSLVIIILVQHQPYNEYRYLSIAT
jgi:hypothetical protein